ncbi:MAG: LuxR C-terminal-related transcriptional regulator [Planctomycetota bacterium]
MPQAQLFGQTGLDALAEWTAGLHASDILTVFAGLSFSSVVLTDHHNRLISLDAGTARRFGYEPGELVGQLIDDLLPPHMRDERDRHRRATLAASGQWGIAIDLYLGVQVWHISRAVRDPEGHLGVLTITLTPPITAELPAMPVMSMYAHVSHPGPLGVLTLGEAEVLRLLALNYSQDEIAEELSRSVKAIERRRTILGKKLSAGNRSELALVGAEAGLHRLTPEQLEVLARVSFSNKHVTAHQDRAAISSDDDEE